MLSQRIFVPNMNSKYFRMFCCTILCFHGYSGYHSNQVNQRHILFQGTYVQNIDSHNNNNKRSHTQLDSRKQVIAFQDRVTTINIKEAQHPLKREKQVIDKSSIMLKISTKSMHRVLV